MMTREQRQEQSRDIFNFGKRVREVSFKKARTQLLSNRKGTTFLYWSIQNLISRIVETRYDD